MQVKSHLFLFCLVIYIVIYFVQSEQNPADSEY